MPTFAGGVYVAAGDVGGDGYRDIVTGPGIGHPPLVRVLSGKTGADVWSATPYEGGFTGGVQVAVADVNRDGAGDVVVGTGVGGAPRVRVLDGRTGDPLADFFAYEDSFRGGVQVAAGDVDGDGSADIVCGTSAGGGPRVRVFSGDDGSVLADFFAYEDGFRGGVYVACGDVDGDGSADIVCGTGVGGGPRVRVFSGRDGSVLADFFAYEDGFRGGVIVAAADFDADAFADIVTGTGPGGGPRVRVVSGETGAVLADRFAYEDSFRGGVLVAAADFTQDGRADLVFGTGPGGAARVRAVDAATGSTLADFFAYDPADNPGPFAEAGPVPGDPFRIDPTVTTNVGDSTTFLYTGTNPVQSGVAPGTIERLRAAVLRGQATARDGSPLPGVAITVLSHPEFGVTQTAGDGTFSMAVNGGGLLTLRYVKAGFLEVQRQVVVPWQDYAWMPDVVLVALDTQVTTIDLAANTSTQVAQGSPATDADGTRQATLLFSQGTQATMTLPDGTSQPLTTLNVRATEYTVGPNGPAAMPAQLPAASGYTYAVEFSVDEAQAIGAQDLSFSQPVITYVENYLDFPVGGAVPAGYYDRQRGLWVPSPNGRVIKVVSETSGAADLDADGNGAADDPAALAALGVTAAEQQRLAALYEPGQSLWRVPVTHFTPWDYNWPYGPPDDATGPQQGPPTGDQDQCDCGKGSVIRIQNQTLGEAVGVTGTPFRLDYESDRVPGRQAAYALQVSLTGPSFPASLRRVTLEVQVAGRRFVETFAPQPNLKHTVTWDGKDAYGRTVQGSQPADVRIDYVYPAVYRTPGTFVASFGGFGGAPLAGNRAAREITISQQRQDSLGAWDARGLGLGGWSLDVHHAYDPTDRVLYLGDGSQRSAQGLQSGIVTTVAGRDGFGSASGDGIQATKADLSRVTDVEVGPDGSFYFSDGFSRIRRVGSDGIIHTVAGNGTAGFSGDGGPATQAQLLNAKKFALGPDGSIYIADGDNYRVRRVGPDGIITTVAGNGPGVFSGDGGPATQAQLGLAVSVAVGPDGSLYIAVQNNNLRRVRRVGPDGIITTVAGGDVYSNPAPEGVPATEVTVTPDDLAVGPDGSLYIADITNYSRVRRVGPDGLINTVVGTQSSAGFGFAGDGGPATQALMNYPQGIAVGPDGSLYIADTYNSRVRRVTPDGIITTLAGTGTGAFGRFSGEGGPASQAGLTPWGLTVAPDGTPYVAIYERVVRITPSLPGLSLGDILIPAEDGSEVYVFTNGGRHLRTIDALTGALRYRFGYDAGGRLASVTDGDGNATTIQHAAAGTPTAIVAPRGQRTTLAPNADGYLVSVTNPANEAVQFTYLPGGLLATLKEPTGHDHKFFYDSLGRLRRDEDPADGFTTLDRTEQARGYTITVTTAEGKTTSYQIEDLATGAQRRVNTGPDGLQTVTLIGTDGSRTVTDPDGTVTQLVLGPDPRFGMLAPLVASAAVTTPQGLTATTAQTRSVTLTNPANPLSLAIQIDTLTIDGRAYTTTFNAAAKTVTFLTPVGRQTVTMLDDKGRVAAVKYPDLDLIQFTYNAQGDLETLKQGMRTVTWAYDAQGNVRSVTDPLTHVTSFTYDLAGRVKQETLPDGSAIGFDYDANGNVKSVTPAGRPVHTFNLTPVDLLEDYIPPDVGAGTNQTHYVNNLDRQPTADQRPDGVTVGYGYDTAHRLSTITQPRGSTVLGYDPVTGNLKTISAPGAGTLTYGYDGGRLTDTTWSGPVSGNVHRTFDSNFRLATESVNGGNAVTFGYDDDGLLTQAGALTLSRDPLNGRFNDSTLGTVTDSLSYNRFGELGAYQAAAGGATLFSVQDTPDDLGRIDQRTETIGGVTHTYVYKYDPAGRLTDVEKNGVLVAKYGYDANGNRLSHTGAGITTGGTYDSQDRLSTYGTLTYTYTANGELQTKTDTATNQTTTYSYDAFGNLLGVTLPSNTQVEYVVDGQNRRVGRKVNGVVVQGFLYRDALGPVAELDGAGNVISRFVYAGGGNVPDYMVNGGVTYRIITDKLGSPRLVVNSATGVVVQRMDYDEFGNVTADTNPGFQPFGFAGGLYDRDTKLVRFGARDYDAATGRWTAKDPVLFEGGQANLYAYVGNDPVNFSDPTGLEPPFPDTFIPPGRPPLPAVEPPPLTFRQAFEAIARELGGVGEGGDFVLDRQLIIKVGERAMQRIGQMSEGLTVIGFSLDVLCEFVPEVCGQCPNIPMT